jgi:hypothetical protein
LKKIGCLRTSAEWLIRPPHKYFSIMTYPGLLSTLSRCSARRSAMQDFVLHGLKNLFHERAAPTNNIVHSQSAGRDRVIEPDFADDDPVLKEYMSSTRSLGLFSAGDIRSIV